MKRERDGQLKLDASFSSSKKERCSPSPEELSDGKSDDDTEQEPDVEAPTKSFQRKVGSQLRLLSSSPSPSLPYDDENSHDAQHQHQSQARLDGLKPSSHSIPSELSRLNPRSGRPSSGEEISHSRRNDQRLVILGVVERDGRHGRGGGDVVGGGGRVEVGLSSSNGRKGTGVGVSQKRDAGATTTETRREGDRHWNDHFASAAARTALI